MKWKPWHDLIVIEVDNGGKVCICGDSDAKVDTDVQNGGNSGKVCTWVGDYTSWLHSNEPDAIAEYTHYTNNGRTTPLAEWADIHHPELREIWAVVRYRGDI